MRLWKITIPATVLILVSAGVVYSLGGTKYPTSEPTKDEITRGAVRHVITTQMERIASGMLKNPAPAFDVPDMNGGKISLDSLINDRPLLIYFVKDGCPCSIDLDPILQKMYKKYDGRVNFAAVIDKDAATAVKWAHDNGTPYPIIPDPSLKIIKGFHVIASAFSALVNKKGEVVKMWPGYNQDLLKDMNEHIAKELGEKPTPFDTMYAPKEKAAGCAFPTSTENAK